MIILQIIFQIERVSNSLVILNYKKENYGRSADRICKSSRKQQGGSLRYLGEKSIFFTQIRVKMLYSRVADESSYRLIVAT